MTPNQKEQFELSAQDKIRVAVSVCGVESVWDELDLMHYDISHDTECSIKADHLKVEADGSIYNEETGRYLTETELEEFVSWAEKENA